MPIRADRAGIGSSLGGFRQKHGGDHQINQNAPFHRSALRPIMDISALNAMVVVLFNRSVAFDVVGHGAQPLWVVLGMPKSRIAMKTE